MKKLFIPLFALAFTFGLTACAEEAETPAEEAYEEAVEEGAPAGDMEDVVGDGEIIDEPGEIEPDNPDDDFMEEDPIVD